MEIDDLKLKLQFYKDRLDRYGKKLTIGLSILFLVGTSFYVIRFFAPSAISSNGVLLFVGIVLSSCFIGTIFSVVFYKYVTRKQIKEAYVKQEETARNIRKGALIGSVIGIVIAIICSRIIGGKVYEIVVGVAPFLLGYAYPFFAYYCSI